MLGGGHPSAWVPGTSAPRGLPRLPGGGGGRQAGPGGGAHHQLRSAQGPQEVRQTPSSPDAREPPPHAACTSAGACCRQAEVGPQLGAGNMTRTRGFRARGQFTLRAPRTAQPWHSGQGPDGPAGEAARPPLPQSGCEEPPDQASPADTGTGGPAAPRPEGTEARAGEAHRPRHCPGPRPVHAAASGLDLAGRGRRGNGHSQGAEVQPPRAGRSQLRTKPARTPRRGARGPRRHGHGHLWKKGLLPLLVLRGGALRPGTPASCPSSWPPRGPAGAEQAATARSQEGAREALQTATNSKKQSPAPARTLGTP